MRFYPMLAKAQEVAGYLPDTYGTIGSLCLEIDTLRTIILTFRSKYEAGLPEGIMAALSRFIERTEGKWGTGSGLQRLQLSLELALVEGEISYLLNSDATVVQRRVDLALIHLRRSIVADSSVRDKWKEAFKPEKNKKPEEHCEKLGGLHFLSHGIWAFKLNAEKERTDLILGTRISDILDEIESVSTPLIITEWKCVQEENQLASMIERARIELRAYSSGSASGYELASVRYVIVVSEDGLPMPADAVEGQVRYKFVNIPVDPKTPSKTKSAN